MNIQRGRQRSRREFNQFCATFGLALPVASSLIKPIWAQIVRSNRSLRESRDGQ